MDQSADQNACYASLNYQTGCLIVVDTFRFAPGEAFQFDWSYETITLQGLPLVIKVAHMKLSHSRMPFVRAYFRETQELVFDAHDRGFAFYGGACRRGIYDNTLRALRVDMKTAVAAVFVGTARQYNHRFLQMCSNHLVDPAACTPASGWGWSEPWPKAT